MYSIPEFPLRDWEVISLLFKNLTILTERSQMAEILDSKEILELKELTNSHILQIEVLLRLLVKKDILTELECIDEFNKLKAEIAEKEESKAIEEKRTNPRLNIGVTVYCNGDYVITRDISIEGVFIKRTEQSHLQPVGSEISLDFDFPGRVRLMPAKGIVMHHGTNGDGMGIFLKRIKERHREFVKRFVMSCL